MSLTESIRNRSVGKNISTPPRLVADLRFSNIEAWAAVSDWDLDFRQLSAGRLKGRVRVLAGPDCTAMKVQLNQAFHQVGHSLPGYVTFGISYPPSGEFKWCGSTTKGDELLNFSSFGGFDGTSGKSFSGCALSIRRETLEELAEILDLPFDFEQIRNGGGVLLGAGQETTRLRKQLDVAFKSVSMTGRTELPEAASLFETGAAEAILRLLARPSHPGWDAVQPARQIALRKALDILEIPENLPISVAGLCRRVGVSAPSLYRAFRDMFGVGTKDYIQARILAAVRSELITARPGTQINDIANRWGIWHMGRFAADYRKQFGELPSETLQGI
jgi:AraC family ethanolamine operon transcriptional activator